MTIAVLGGGIVGCIAALELADSGRHVHLFERRASLLTEASRWNEGKLHLGFVYAADGSGKTASTMLRGAIRWVPIVSRWVDLKTSPAIFSRPFNYCVVADSQINVEAIERHFQFVASQIAAALVSEQDTHPGLEGQPAFRRRAVDENVYDTRHIIAQFETPEVAVNTDTVANLLGMAVHSHPRVDVCLGKSVKAIEELKSGDFRLSLSTGEPEGPYSHAINALWANRIRLDQHLNLGAGRPCMKRFKLGVYMQRSSVDKSIPSVTFMLGPYGDFVGWDSGKLYFSWYPTGMTGWNSSTEDTDWAMIRSELDLDQIAALSLAGLARLVPGSRNLLKGEKLDYHVEGGAIVAWGESDIDDRHSQLHERHAIGVHQRGRFLSVDTGKYTTGPLFGVEAANRITGKY